MDLDNGRQLLAIGRQEAIEADALLAAGTITFEEHEVKKTATAKKQSEGRVAVAQAEEEKKQQIRQQTEQIAYGLIDVYTNISRKRYDDELKQAQNLFDKKLITEKEYNARVARTKRGQAQQDKIKSIFSIFISTAENIVKSFPDPLLMGLAAGLGSVQSAAVLTQPLPQFRRGNGWHRWPWYRNFRFHPGQAIKKRICY